MWTSPIFTWNAFQPVPNRPDTGYLSKQGALMHKPCSYRHLGRPELMELWDLVGWS